MKLNHSPDIEYYKDLLRDRNLKATSTRLKLLEKLAAFGSAMPYSAIQKNMAPIDRVTLYRTLESLTKNGIIHKAFEESNEIFYAICGNTCSANHHQHNHIHFRCLTCLTVTCEMPTKSISINIPDYQIHQVSISLKGICKSCQ